MRRPLVVMSFLAAAAVTLSADTLVLRNGNRLQGRLAGVRDGIVEFEESRFGGSRVVRVDLADVRTIEIDRDDDRRPPSRDPGPGSGARPRGLREREISVSSRTAWTDTGVDVRAGQTLYFDASGRVRWGPRRQDGPEGESDSPRNPGRPIPSRPAAALIGRVGDDAPFFVGDDRDGIRVRGAGRLFLGINDDVLTDNTGEFRVTVAY